MQMSNPHVLLEDNSSGMEDNFGRQVILEANFGSQFVLEANSGSQFDLEAN